MHAIGCAGQLLAKGEYFPSWSLSNANFSPVKLRFLWMAGCDIISKIIYLLVICKKAQPHHLIPGYTTARTTAQTK